SFHFSASCPPLPLHSFPTRRSSDLVAGWPPFGTSSTILPSWTTIPRSAPSARMAKGSLIQIARFRSIILNLLPEMGLQNDPQRRSEEHTSELQSRGHLVCRLLLEKK